MEHISDDDILRAEDAVRLTLKAGADAGKLQHRPAVCHAGVLYGQLRALGMAHGEAVGNVAAIAHLWAEGAAAARPADVLGIGDDEILALVAELPRIPVSDWGGLFNLGVLYGQARQAGRTAAAAGRLVGAWLVQWYGGANPWPAPSHPDPLQGQLRIEGGAYVDDTGPRLPVFLHLGDLIGHGLVRGVDAILPALDQAAAWGYHGIRSWFQLHLTTGKWLRGPTENGWNPLDAPDRFVAILEAAAERGLAWHVAAGGTKGLSEFRERELFDLLADAIGEVGPRHFALVEGVNEARDTARDATPAAVERSLRPVRERQPGILYALSAYTGHEDRVLLAQWTPAWMEHYQVHGYRDGRAHDKIRHIFSLGYDGEGTPTRRLGWQGEPWGPGRIVSAQANHHEIDADVMILGACMAAMARQAWCVMSGPGVVYTDEPLDAMPGIPEVPGVVRRLPQDLMRWSVFAHSGPNKRGQRIHAVRDDARDVREDYAIDPASGRFLAIRYGPPEQRHDFARERVFWDQEMYHEGRWGRVFGGRLS